MRGTRRAGYDQRAGLAGVVFLLASLGACEFNGATALGGTCAAASDCVGGACVGGRCVDPLGDEDGDTLLNGIELSLGSDPSSPDTDGDGVPDGEELGVFDSPFDADRDGRADIFESLTNDADSDCLVDQLDPRNDEPDVDLAILIPKVCRQAGICGTSAGLKVRCESAAPVCDYSGVAGYRETEATCDGLDENCDGRVDEGFEDRTGDGKADCGPPRPAVGLTGISGGGLLSDGQHRVRLVVGAPVSGRRSGWALSPVSGSGRMGEWRRGMAP